MEPHGAEQVTGGSSDFQEAAVEQTPVPERKRTRWRVIFYLLLLLGISIFGVGSTFLMGGGLSVDKETLAEADLKMLITQLKTYEMTMMQPPTQTEGLGVLVSKPTTGHNLHRWRQLMMEIPLDPWGKPYQYTLPAARSKSEPYDLFSSGPDRKSGTKDDIGHWR